MRHDVRVGHEDFGRAFPCVCQRQASDEQRLSRLRRFANLGVLAQITFARTEPDGRGATTDVRERFRIALDAARLYAEGPRGWFTLTGASGTGKTHLAAAIGNRCMERGQPVLFALVPDLLDHLRAAFNPDHEVSYDELVDQVKNIPVLVLDDLGTQRSTPWAEEKLLQVFNHRYAAGLPTVITTNVALAQLDERMQSRLLDPRTGTVVDLGNRGPGQVSTIGTVPAEMRASMTFAAFEPNGRATEHDAQQSLHAALAYAKNFARNPDGWLVLLGDPGCGKTHLAVAIADERLGAGQDVFFSFVPDLLDHLRYTFSPDSRVTYDELFERVRQAPLLILDDLGAQSSTPWAQEKLYQIVVYRHNLRLPTIITMRDLPSGSGDPIASRINDPRVVEVREITAPDYRQAGVVPPKGRPPQHPSRGR